MNAELPKNGFKGFLKKAYSLLNNEVLGKCIQFVISIATISSIIWGIGQYEAERKDRIFSSNVTAWQLLASARIGEFGQKGAVELLSRHGASMSGLQLNQVDLSKGDFQGAQLPLAMIINSNWSNSDLRKSDLSEAILDWSDMSFANISDEVGDVRSVKGVNFTGAILPTRTKNNFVDLVVQEGCVNKLGPMPTDSLGPITVPTECSPSLLRFGQAPCLSKWCNTKYSYSFYNDYIK